MKIIENAYYGNIFYLEMPSEGLPVPFGPNGLGGNITLVSYVLGRKEIDPNAKYEWNMDMIFRYYAKERENDLVNTHRKMSPLATGEEVEKKMMEVMMHMSTLAGTGRYEGISIGTDGLHVLKKLVDANKPWLHVSSASEKALESYKDEVKQG